MTPSTALIVILCAVPAAAFGLLLILGLCRAAAGRSVREDTGEYE